MQNLSEVNIKALAEILSEKTSYHISLVAEIREKRNGEKYINIESQELKQYTGVMSSIYKTVKICNFGGCLTQDNKSYWMPVNFSFEYLDGGSNGATITTAFFNFATQTWSIN